MHRTFAVTQKKNFTLQSRVIAEKIELTKKKNLTFENSLPYLCKNSDELTTRN
jgi:hypothetical protein